LRVGREDLPVPIIKEKKLRHYIERAIRNWCARQHGDHEDEQGFTLIELMVVLLIMAILLAIAIPTFLGVTSSAHNRAAQSDLRNALDTAQTVYTSQGEYPISSGISDMQASEPALDFVASNSVPSANSNQVSVDIVSQNAIVLAAQAAGGTCWFLANAETTTGASALGRSGPGVWYSVGVAPTSADACRASNYNNTTSGAGWTTAPSTWVQNHFPSAP